MGWPVLPEDSYRSGHFKRWRLQQERARVSKLCLIGAVVRVGRLVPLQLPQWPGDEAPDNEETRRD
jgi:hypothetical protein